MKYGLVQRDISKKVPATPEELLTFFRQEMLESYRQAREVLNRLTNDIDSGFVQLGDVIIREVDQVADLFIPPAVDDPVGSFALTPAGVYYKDAGGWVFLGPLTAGDTVVTEQTFGQASTPGLSGEYSRTDHTHGTPVFPTVNDTMVDDTIITEAALNAELRATRQEVEKLRILVMQLINLEMGEPLDNGWEAAGA